MPPSLRVHTTCAALLLGATLAHGTHAQTAVNDFSAGPPSGRYAFASATPKALGDLLKGPQADGTSIVAQLFLPETEPTTRLPAVIFIHGSGGVYDAMFDYWPKQLNAAGYAMLAVDSFGPRGVKSTAADQSQVPFAADMADAFAALKLLAGHPRIDPKRIAILGVSRGGITATRTAVERVIASQQLANGLRYAAHVSMYSGGCVGLFRLSVKPGVFGSAPMLWVHGDADDYAPIGPCQDYAGRIKQAGTPVEFVVIAGAQHKFDSDDPRRIRVNAAQTTRPDCPLETDIETLAAHDRNNGQRVGGAALAELMKSCRSTGASVQGDRSARDQAAQAVLDFLGRAMPR